VTIFDSDCVVIVRRSDTALSASVRDAQGIVDVRWTIDGWDCTCVADDFECAHISAVRAIARVAS
jgi:hypothetical protein